MVILDVKNVSKIYPKVAAVQDISFTVKEGEILGLLGPNGAGKTTTICMILGILEPSGGSIEIMNGMNADEVRRKIGFSAVYTHVPANLSVLQNLKIFGLLYDVPDLQGKIESLLEEFDLTKFGKTKTGLLSSGELARLNLAKALINEPKLLLLDEPTASLDPSVAKDVREKIRNYTKRTGAAVVWTSHNMNEIEKMCSRVLFLSRGRILLAGDPKTLPGQNGKNDLEELFIAVAREPLSINH
ncbi:MAG: ABC transporter ATP-binding protein [Desulfobulbaceae bacterium BRH_c16a]|nr:MAG: ABC transporter ATP-binding protein [Desulfobulbaceae bacterium BRH_c16a]